MNDCQTEIEKLLAGNAVLRHRKIEAKFLDEDCDFEIYDGVAFFYDDGFNHLDTKWTA